MTSRLHRTEWFEKRDAISSRILRANNQEIDGGGEALTSRADAVANEAMFALFGERLPDPPKEPESSNRWFSVSSYPPNSPDTVRLQDKLEPKRADGSSVFHALSEQGAYALIEDIEQRIKYNRELRKYQDETQN